MVIITVDITVAIANDRHALAVIGPFNDEWSAHEFLQTQDYPENFRVVVQRVIPPEAARLDRDLALGEVAGR